MIELRRGVWGLLVVGAALAGCFKPVGNGESEATSSGELSTSGGTASSGEQTTASGVASGSEGGTTGTGQAPTSSAASDTSTTSDATAMSAATGIETVCGNGLIEAGELCDDGDANGEGERCTPECQPATCGDGHVCTACSPAEECDDGNLTPEDGCAPQTCTRGVCGNGKLEANEECELGEENCATNCTLKLKRVFVTSETFTGDFGAIGGADAICRKLGQAHFTPKREFVAWLSAGESAAQRIGVSTDPYLLPKDVMVANGTLELLAAPLQSPINMNELGNLAVEDTAACGVAGVWTGTTAEGQATTATCGGWSGRPNNATVGDFRVTDIGWTFVGECASCDTVKLHLYCIERALP